MGKAGDKSGKSSLRIIAGSLKGRRIRFSGSGIRPTGDRVRETLFNWLGARVTGAVCLDLFAGSGALGLEALSRGASRVTFVEKQSAAAARIRENLAEFGVGDGAVVAGDAHRVNLAAHGPFDIVFLDPPFDSANLSDLCKLLNSSGCLAPGALIYAETARKPELPDFPDGWEIIRDKNAGQVRFLLLQRLSNDSQE